MLRKFACTTEQYNTLYSRYLHQPEKLLEMAGYAIQHDLLDLCGGTGAISKVALKRGAPPDKITLLDLNPRLHCQEIVQVRADALDGLRQLVDTNRQFDVVVCRQAFAYLEIDGVAGHALAQWLSQIIRPGGRFIFNSFIRPRWMLKTYQLDGDRYIEMAGHLRRWVFRLQVQLGKGHDLTVSKWHREERIFEIFNPYFQIETRWSNNAIYWICTRRRGGRDEKN